MPYLDTSVLVPLVVPEALSGAVEDGDFLAAARLVGGFGLGLRGGDALHLAVARRIGAAKLVTLDRRLAAAALATGLGAGEPLPGF